MDFPPSFNVIVNKADTCLGTLSLPGMDFQKQLVPFPRQCHRSGLTPAPDIGRAQYQQNLLVETVNHIITRPCDFQAISGSSGLQRDEVGLRLVVLHGADNGSDKLIYPIFKLCDADAHSLRVLEPTSVRVSSFIGLPWSMGDVPDELPPSFYAVEAIRPLEHRLRFAAEAVGEESPFAAVEGLEHVLLAVGPADGKVAAHGLLELLAGDRLSGP